MSPRAAAITLSILWAAVNLIIGLAHLALPPYGRAYLDVMASLYPGFEPEGGALSVVVLVAYAAVDGAIAGSMGASLYRRLA